MSDVNVRPKLALITGGTKGLGFELTLAFAERDYETIALYRSDRAAALELQRVLGDKGLQARVLCHDVTSPDLETRALAGVDLASFDCTLVNGAAAAFHPKPFHLTAWQEFADQLETTVKGAFNCSAALIPHMVRARSGTIVNILSETVIGAPVKGFSSYSTAKYALLGLTRALAAEYHVRGVRVLGVSPGYMETPLTAAWDERLRASITAAKAPQSAREVAAAILKIVGAADTVGNGENYAI